MKLLPDKYMKTHPTLIIITIKDGVEYMML